MKKLLYLFSLFSPIRGRYGVIITQFIWLLWLHAAAHLLELLRAPGVAQHAEKRRNRRSWFLSKDACDLLRFTAPKRLKIMDPKRKKKLQICEISKSATWSSQKSGMSLTRTGSLQIQEVWGKPSLIHPQYILNTINGSWVVKIIPKR